MCTTLPWEKKIKVLLKRQPASKMSSLPQCLLWLFLIKACDSVSKKRDHGETLKDPRLCQTLLQFRPVLFTSISVTKMTPHQDLEPESVLTRSLLQRQLVPGGLLPSSVSRSAWPCGPDGDVMVSGAVLSPEGQRS